MKKKKSGRGGPRPGAGMKPLYGEPMETIGVRVTRGQRQEWEAAAAAEGLSLSEWVRRMGDAAAKRKTGDGK